MITCKKCGRKYQQEDLLDGEEFYNLMQFYRLAPIEQQARVIKTFEKVKDFIRINYKRQSQNNNDTKKKNG